MGNKKSFRKRYGLTGLIIKIDAVVRKKWVMFFAMQQNSATLIYDLNTLKGTWKKKMAQPFKIVQLQAW